GWPPAPETTLRAPPLEPAAPPAGVARVPAAVTAVAPAHERDDVVVPGPGEELGDRVDEEVGALQPLEPPRVDHHPAVEQTEAGAHAPGGTGRVPLHVDAGRHHAD